MSNNPLETALLRAFKEAQIFLGLRVPPPDLSDSFLYAGKEASFEVMARHSNQKEILALELARRISERNNKQNLKILDIGTSRGTLFGLLSGILKHLGFMQVAFTLVEPDKDSVNMLQPYARGIVDSSVINKFSIEIVQRKWEQFDPDLYDEIICAHMIYHLDPEMYDTLFLKMIKALKPNGRLFIIAREKEDNQAFNFIQHIKTLSGEQFNEITIQDALPALRSIVAVDASLSMEEDRVEAKVDLPFQSNQKEAQAVVAFFLQRGSWNELSAETQTDIMNSYGNSDIQLTQPDRIVTITRTLDYIEPGTNFTT